VSLVGLVIRVCGGPVRVCTKLVCDLIVSNEKNIPKFCYSLLPCEGRRSGEAMMTSHCRLAAGELRGITLGPARAWLPAHGGGAR
jgi:hypothetical protein